MFDTAWLDSLDEEGLHSTYNACQHEAKRLRREGQWGLSMWWYRNAAQVCDALGKLYLTKAEPSFVREQLELEGMPHRSGPDWR